MDSLENDIVTDRVYSFDLGLSLVFPSGKYGKMAKFVEKGISITGFIQTKPESNSFIGVELYNHWLENINADVVENINGILVDLEENVQTYVSGFLINYRVYPDFSLPFFDTYGEFSSGYKLFYATTSQNSFDDSNISSFDFHSNSGALQYGFSLGGIFGITEYYFLNIKLSYFQSGVVNYLVADDDLVFDYPLDGFNKVKTSMNGFSIYVGVNWIL